jgi:glycine C-acetyltransferase
MPENYLTHVRETLDRIRADGFYKCERVIESPQSPQIGIVGGPTEVLNFCANNYLGLADDPRLVQAAKAGLDAWGFGMASVRFICGTQSVHKKLESALSAFLRTDDSILYTSCFDANGGLFETLLSEEDAVISDELNHASIVDGIRLCKAKRFRYRNNDMADLAAKPRAGRSRGRPLQVDCDRRRILDGRHHRGSQVDLRPCRPPPRTRDGRRPRTPSALSAPAPGRTEFCGVKGVDIITGTLGRRWAARRAVILRQREIVELLRQRSRPYLFSIRWRLASPPRRSKSWRYCKVTTACDGGGRCARMATASGTRCRRWVSTWCRDSIPSSP